MKVLILSITAGYGHHAAAKSVAGALTEKGVEVESVDVYKSVNKLLYWAVDKFYLIFTKYTRKPYSAIYNHLATKKRSEKKRHSSGFLTRYCSKRFEKFVAESQPDVIVCTHVYASLIINDLKRKNKFTDIPTIGIVTDYTMHPFWDCVPFTEYVEVANEIVSEEAKALGIEESKILPLGIPIDKKFTKASEKNDARKALNLPIDKKIVLVMAGSMGYGDIPSIISDIHKYDKDCLVLAVCGNNKKHYKKLTSLANNNVKIFTFTENINLFMDAADCIITKPGGLSTSEAIAKELPMIFVNPIPGHEEKNLQFFTSNNAGIDATGQLKVYDALYQLFDSPGKLDEIKKQLSALAKPNATDDIANFVISICEKDNRSR
ncbi:MAG: galactosyldiacylglycerol synthase [Oscillospiraceae bacterium]|nr:galactosyldiacylglycerol synthase [Oscillospiraceae bacterium]